MSELTHRVNVVIGDWSGDGHNQREEEVWMSNKPPEDVKEAYRKGCSLLSFDIINDFCCSYGDNNLPTVQFWQIVRLCPDFADGWELDGEVTEVEDEFRSIDSHEWSYLVFAVAKIGDRELIVDQSPYESSWKIGGYGFYEPY